MNVKIRKSGDDDPVSHIFYRNAAKLLWKFRIDSLHPSVLADQILLLKDFHCSDFFCVYKIASQGKGLFHIYSSFPIMFLIPIHCTENKKREFRAHAKFSAGFFFPEQHTVA
jgi:hypothetical protein